MFTAMGNHERSVGSATPFLTMSSPSSYLSDKSSEDSRKLVRSGSGNARRRSTSHNDFAQGRKSLSKLEIRAADVALLLKIKVMAADMPEFMQVHAFRSTMKAYKSLGKFSARQIAQDVKKEFDSMYGPTWHCIVGTSFGSFVTHSTGCFLYFAMEKMLVMLFKTRIEGIVTKSLF